MKYFRFYFFFLFLGCFFVPSLAFADARLFITAGTNQIEEGDRITIYARINAEESINAITGAISFSSPFLRLISISKDESIINFWTQDGRQVRDKIFFEGVILNPGFRGQNGVLFKMIFEARESGNPSINFTEGAVLANDGFGTNVLTTLSGINLRIIRKILPPISEIKKEEIPIIKEDEEFIEKEDPRIVALPVIVEYPGFVKANEQFRILGKGEPRTLTKIIFKDVSVKSLGEKFIASLFPNKEKLGEVLVRNNEEGIFEYLSPKNLVAGVYNATPFLVDENTSVERPGFGAQLLVTDSKVVRFLVVVINVLGLLIPVVILSVIIYFIPWYSWLRMRVLKKKIALEEEKVEMGGRELEREEKILDKRIEKLTNDEK